MQVEDDDMPPFFERSHRGIFYREPILRSGTWPSSMHEIENQKVRVLTLGDYIPAGDGAV